MSAAKVAHCELGELTFVNWLVCYAGGAVGMLGLTPDQDPNKDGVPLDPPPSTRQGFGRMQLTSSVPLSSAAFRLQVCT